MLALKQVITAEMTHWGDAHVSCRNSSRKEVCRGLGSASSFCVARRDCGLMDGVAARLGGWDRASAAPKVVAVADGETRHSD